MIFVQPLMLRKFMLDNYIVSSVARISVDTAVAKLQHLVEKLCGQGDEDEQAARTQKSRKTPSFLVFFPNISDYRWPKSCWTKQHQFLPSDSWITQMEVTQHPKRHLKTPKGSLRKPWRHEALEAVQPVMLVRSCQRGLVLADSTMLLNFLGVQPKWNVVVEKSMFCMSPRMVHTKGWTDFCSLKLVDNQKTHGVFFRHQLLGCLFQASN